MTDAAGRVLAGSQAWDPATTIAGRDFLRVHAERADVGTYVSVAFEGRATRTASFAVSRRRTTSDGRFAGTIHVALSPEYFARVFAEVAPPLAHAAVLVRADGQVLTREPYQAANAPLLSDSPLMAAIAQNPQSGFLVGSFSFDGIERVYAYRKVGGYPVYVGFGTAITDLMAHWRTNLIAFGVVALAASLTLLFVSRIAFRAARAEQTAIARLADALDATETRVAERTNALAESEARFRATFEQAAVGVAHVGLDGRWLLVNKRLCGMLGYTDAELRATTFQDITHPDDLDADLDNVRCLLAGERATYSMEKRYIREDGARLWIELTVALVRDEDGTPRYFISVVQDIVARKAAEAVLSRGKAELELLVAERTRDLERTQQQLAHAQRMEALGQLAGGIAHDFNNVLQAVQGGAGLISKRAGEITEVRRLVQLVADAAARGSAVTHRLLAFARRGTLRTEAVDPVALLEDMREIFAHTLGSGIAGQVLTEPGLPRLLADKGQLETVLINLATNARDAMPDGGTLTLSATLDVMDCDGPPSVVACYAARVLKTGYYVRLCVTDTGTGMSPEVLARATEPFFTTKAQGQGTGLGLAMAKGFAEQSGGGLTIESAPGQGTTVMLWFPASAHQAVTAPLGEDGPQHTPQADPERRIRILLVDDDPIVREVTAEGLKDEGFSICLAASGAAALAVLDAGERVDLLISDLSMPGMDGLAVIREAQKRRRHLPAILLTGFATNAAELAVGGVLSGSFSLLRKPVTVRHIIERIEMLLEGTDVEAPRDRPS